MSMFNDALIKAFRTGRYICPECGALMEFEDEGRSTLICLNCGYDEDIDHYGSLMKNIRHCAQQKRKYVGTKTMKTTKTMSTTEKHTMKSMAS